MKGISEIIATILMLMITLGISGTAYLFISGALTQQTQGIELADGFCSGGTQTTIIIRNLGTNTISFVAGDCTPAAASPATCGALIVTRTIGGGVVDLNGNAVSIPPSASGTITDTGCTTPGVSQTCIYRLTPPAGRGIEARIICSG